MTKATIRVSAGKFKEIKELAIAKKQKIAAIKLARSSGKRFPPCEQVLADGTRGLSHRVSLRDAKDAVEVMMGIKTRADAEACFTPQMRIKKVIVEGETGNIELDIDELQLRCLDGLEQGIPLSEVAAMTDLITFIRDWQGQGIHRQ